ncbi:MAG: hypothetical protein LC772_12855, partial [Chloroflexi bacterium]|nr:hypothetical protein [Chloroflexota bacterium]
EQGLEQGLEQGMRKGLQNALIASLQARFGPLPEDLAASTQAVSDPARLHHLNGTAALASSLDEFRQNFKR